MFLMADKIAFAKWLNEELEVRSWSQSELARRSGLGRAIISKALMGDTNPQPDTLSAIARALSVPPESVFRVAGLLPGAPPISEDMEEAIHILQQMDADDVRESVAILRAKLEHKQQNKGSQHRSQPYKQSRGTPAHHLLNEKK